MIFKRSKKLLAGFTIIELLVVIAIIGLLASIVMTAVRNTQNKARDAKRLSDIKQIKSGMDIYYNTGSGYPDAALFVAGTQISCNGIPALTIPADPLNDALHTYAYSNPSSATPFSSCGGTVYSQYSVSFVLEKTGLTYTVNQDGQFNPALPAL